MNLLFASFGDEVDEVDAILAQVGPALGEGEEAGCGDAKGAGDGGLRGVLLCGAQKEVERQDKDVEV